MVEVSQEADCFFTRLIDPIASGPRLYEIETPLDTSALNISAFTVERFVGKEALSTLYEYHIDCLSSDTHIPLKSLLGQQVTLRIRLADGTQDARSGYVSSMAQLGSDGHWARYRLTLMPWLVLARYQRRSRVFQDIRIHDLIDEVLGTYHPRNNWRMTPDADALLAGLRPRSYCCQYRESDYDFLLRILTEEGIGFYFEEAEEKSAHASWQQLVLFSDSTCFANDRSAITNGGIRFERQAGVHIATLDRIQTFGAHQQMQTATTTIASWDYKAKRVTAITRSTTHSDGGDHAPRIESYDWAGVYAFATMDEAEHYARLLRETTDARFKTWSGDSTVRTFRPGAAFHLIELPSAPRALVGSGQSVQRFSLLGILHAGVNHLSTEHWQLPVPSLDSAVPFDTSELPTIPDHLPPATWDDMLAAAQVTGYANRFTALRTDIPWRPTLYDGTGALLNPKPTAFGPQTAIVVGADGTTANAGTMHTDALGRIRIRYHWQQTESSTCWVRVTQMYAGPGYGAQFIPRIGQEVLVKFLDNDIDRPIVLGTLYNGQGQNDETIHAQAHDHAPAGQDNRIGNSASPAWHGDAAASHGHAGFLSGFKSVALGTNGYVRQSNQLIFDDTSGRLRTMLATDTAATQLHLGHLIHQADNFRGSFRGTGWELRTDAYGAIRAGKGLLLTTYPGTTPEGYIQPSAENTPGIALLKQAKGFADTFNKAAIRHQTVQFILVKSRPHPSATQQRQPDDRQAPIDIMLQAISGVLDAQDGSTEGKGETIPHMHAPLVVITAQAGIDVAASDGLHIAAGEVVHLASGRDMQIAADDTLTMHTGQAIGLLAGSMTAGENNAGLKLYAGQGDVELQAQSDGMIVAAKEWIKLLSANSHIDIAAAKSITLCTTEGASLTMEGGNITFACPGTLSIKAASKRFAGPTTMLPVLPELPASSMPHTRQFVLHSLDGIAMKGAAITAYDPGTKTPLWSSVLDSAGQSTLMTEQDDATSYTAIMGFKENVFHFYDTHEPVLDDSEDAIFEDEHPDRDGE